MALTDPNILFIFDADNTLWDTNSVFRTAQLSLLQFYASANPSFVLDEELQSLRQIDRLLFQHLGRFEYDFRLLALALGYHYFLRCPLDEAVRDALERSANGLPVEQALICEEAHLAYAVNLQNIPPLLPDVIPVLQSLRAAGEGRVALALFSEGDSTRLERILQVHGLVVAPRFDLIEIGTKSKERFLKVQEEGRCRLHLHSDAPFVTVVIGDSLRREIKFGNQIGSTTVYIPAGFMGLETPSCDDEQPDYILDKLEQLPLALRPFHLL